MRPLLPVFRQSTPLLHNELPRRARRASSQRRERAQAAALEAAQDTYSLVPMALVAAQTTACSAAAGASYALGPQSDRSCRNLQTWSIGLGFVALAVAAQSLQIGTALKRRADSITAVTALNTSAAAIVCAGAYVLAVAEAGQDICHLGIAAGLLGLGWLSHVAAMGAQVHRDEMAWGMLPQPIAMARSSAVVGALSGLATSMAVGGVALLTKPSLSHLPNPAVLGAALLVTSVAPAVAALTSGLRNIHASN